MPLAAESKYRQILGIRFFTGSAAEAVEIAVRGGLVVAPAAPGLVQLEFDAAYREALLNSDIALTDSGFMILLWRFLQREKITRTSGLEYFKALIADPSLRQPGSALWIMPGEKSRDRNLAWLNSQGLSVASDDCYLAPVYGEQNINDAELLSIVQKRRPAQIVVTLGGGTQEKLGHYLKQNAGYRPGIHCIGAAIGFLSGDQVNIPVWADHFFLGWIFRCVSQPAKFLPRYWKARRLLPMMLKYRESSPVNSR